MPSNIKQLNRLPVEELWRLYPHTLAVKCSRGQWFPHRHLVYLSKAIAAGIAKGGFRCIINLPPSYGKSFLTSFWLPVWHFDMYPERNLILAGYNSDHVKRFGRMTRDQISENNLITAKLKDSNRSSTQFTTTRGGEYWAVPMSGAIGKHGDTLILDDPIKTWKEGLSQRIHEEQWDWFNSVFYTRRKNERANIIVLMQRWHRQDICGRLLAEHFDKWTHLCLPMTAQPGGDLLKRKPGQTLCPAINSQAMTDKMKASTAPTIWNAIYDQNPSAEEGSIWKRAYWQRWEELPMRLDDIIVAADMNTQEGKDNDYTVFEVWGRRGVNVYLMDVVKGVWDFDKQMETFQNVVKAYPKAKLKLIENKSNGPALESVMKKKIAGLVLVEPEGGKYVRAQAVTHLLIGKNVFVPANEQKYPWVRGFIDEAANFPDGKHDDQVDAASMALRYFDEAISSNYAALGKM